MVTAFRVLGVMVIGLLGGTAIGILLGSIVRALFVAVGLPEVEAMLIQLLFRAAGLMLGGLGSLWWFRSEVILFDSE